MMEWCVQRFTEANVQTLKEAVKLTRDEAIQGLKHVSGDRNKAFTNELGALSLNISCVDDLVRNYALQRHAFPIFQASPWVSHFLVACLERAQALQPFVSESKVGSADECHHQLWSL